VESNAHPMVAEDVALIHNGIIENHKDLKFSLESDGYVFESETDTEAIVYFLQRELSRGSTPRDAVRAAMQVMEGTYAIAAIFRNFPDSIIAARQKSSLAVGFGENMCVGSDADSLSSISQEVAYLEDGDMVEITSNGAVFFDKNSNRVERKLLKGGEAGIVEKGNYEHFMLKEIMDQPNAIRNTLANNKIDSSILDNVDKILIMACGTSCYAGMVAKYWFENFLRIPTDIEIASEFRYRNPVILENTLAISISQSGETLDTLGAIEFVRSKSNNKTIAIVNVKNSATARASDIVFYTEAGIEMCVASTKTFTSQLAILASIAFCKNEFLQQQLLSIPTLCETALGLSGEIKRIAEIIYNNHNAIYLGRGTMYPIAMEGALKLKEISYIHAEGFAAGEMKHGPIALIDDNVPVIFLCPKNEMFDKALSNLQETMARGKNIIVITEEEMAHKIHPDIRKILVPSVKSAVAPILYSIPLQLLAYHTAVLRGTDVDRPRNLAKSVTVE
jgi:glucosamine--fructose-6-phosphate aminotransferase (isomerizing)